MDLFALVYMKVYGGSTLKVFRVSLFTSFSYLNSGITTHETANDSHKQVHWTENSWQVVANSNWYLHRSKIQVELHLIKHLIAMSVRLHELIGSY